MNILRTIRQEETRNWVDLLFKVGPHPGDYAPSYPPRFPFPVTIHEPLEGHFIYVVYQGMVTGFGKIACVLHHSGELVGSDGRRVSLDDEVVLDGPLIQMPSPLYRRGFTGLRYIAEDLHSLPPERAQAILDSLP